MEQDLAWLLFSVASISIAFLAGRERGNREYKKVVHNMRLKESAEDKAILNLYSWMDVKDGTGVTARTAIKTEESRRLRR